MDGLVVAHSRQSQTSLYTWTKSLAPCPPFGVGPGLTWRLRIGSCFLFDGSSRVVVCKMMVDMAVVWLLTVAVVVPSPIRRRSPAPPFPLVPRLPRCVASSLPPLQVGGPTKLSPRSDQRFQLSLDGTESSSLLHASYHTSRVFVIYVWQVLFNIWYTEVFVISPLSDMFSQRCS